MAKSLTPGELKMVVVDGGVHVALVVEELDLLVHLLRGQSRRELDAQLLAREAVAVVLGSARPEEPLHLVQEPLVGPHRRHVRRRV